MGGRGGASHIAAGGVNSSTVPKPLKAAEKFLLKSFDKKYFRSIMRLIVKAPEHVRAIWEKLAKDFKYAGPAAGTAHYSPVEDAVRLNIEESMSGSDYQTQHQVLFHEFGHMADHLIQRALTGSRWLSYSESYKGGLLGKTAKEEVEAMLSKKMTDYGYTRDMAANQIIFELNRKYSLIERSDISDMLEGGGIGVSHPLRVGHGLDYWSRVDNCQEIFAEITSAEIASPGSLAAIRSVFPRTYQVYTEMIDDWRKKK